ncbi:hypothetical protein D9611_009344 [Ephemerocybe angulata]|uniref:Uncharacterized protein n=1 Tax=Ephemerocybe angulata TaxID=980116 RepID=A0A8H5BGN0_9AGAR|nr:hypothetical protein D9611_009344 [Tulosesus angulatus]
MDEAEDSLPTLHSLSLVSKQCAFRARRRIFKHINLGYGSNAIEPMERLRNLRILFGKNETLASCVKSINIRMNLYKETLFIENLPPVLQRLTSLSSVQLTDSATRSFRWEWIPKRVADAIAECLLQPDIYEVAIKGLWAVPSQVIFSSPSLRSLRLERMLGTPGADTRTFASTTKLTELVVVAESGGHFEWTAASHPKVGLRAEKSFVHVVGQWKESYFVCTIALSAADEDDIFLLPQVKHLDIGVVSYSCGAIGEPLYFCCSEFVQDMRMTLSKYGSNNLEVLESLSLQIDILTATCKVVNDHSLSILPDTEEWSFLDEYLSGLANKFNRLQVKLEFVIQRDFYADELELWDTHETEAVIDQLSEEASAKLARTGQTGRLLVAVSITFPVYDL